MSSIVKNLPDGVRVVPQGQYVANSLKDYLNRHPQMEQMITKQALADISQQRVRINSRNLHRFPS